MAAPASNLGATSASKQTTKSYFNNIYLGDINVSQNVDDAILGYFLQVADNEAGARALASAVILTSVSQGVDPMSTLAEFQKIPAGNLSTYLTMFLNLNRVGTSFLGINNAPRTTKYVERMIRA
jgi:hypothetical protein